MQQRVYLIRN